MAIYHLEAKVISRGAGRSAVAAAAYMSCSQILNDYDGVQHDYTRKQGLVWQQVFLPENAPEEWQDRSILWNAVEQTEKTKDSRLAREFVAALPKELSLPEWQDLLSEFIRENFVADGMCADTAIHDTDGHNPHAHILLTVRPLDEQGNWQYKTEKEYLCVRGGEERGFTSSEFQAAQREGWEKQYPYKVGKKKVYMAPSAAEAQGYERISKHPKSTRFGRQNPISQLWNSEEQLLLWREQWADTVNRALERADRPERIDHRSNAARGITEQPTVHEGVTVRTLEKQGIPTERGALNRQIRADNALLRELKAQIRQLLKAVQNTVPALAEAMETLRGKIVLLRYQLRSIGIGKEQGVRRLDGLKTKLTRHTALVQQVRSKKSERSSLQSEKKSTSRLNIPKQHELTRRITELTEDLEELRSEKSQLLRELGCEDDAGLSSVKKDISALESGLKKLEQQEDAYSAELNGALTQYTRLQDRAAELDPDELLKARLALRNVKEQAAARQLKNVPDPDLWRQSEQDAASLLGEDGERMSVREKLRRIKGEEQEQKNRQRQGRER